ncbi:hypothetical protein [Nonomuraea rubra]|uniref:hypothetical protein n=1 Tax=Nonomuraea rubra TaxID=46180 RepID=UPI003F4CC59D
MKATRLQDVARAAGVDRSGAAPLRHQGRAARRLRLLRSGAARPARQGRGGQT